MTNFTWPVCTFEPLNRIWQLKAISQSSVSPYTGAIKAATSGMLWTAEATFHFPKHDKSIDFQAFLEQLEGPVNPVFMYDWRRPTILGNLAEVGEPWSDNTMFTDGTGWSGVDWDLVLSSVALVGARSISVAGFSASQLVLHRGDLLGVGDNLLQVMSDVTSDASGNATISVLPNVRKGVLAGTAIIIDRPRVLMRMTPESEIGIDRQNTLGAPITLRFVEAIDQ